MSEQTADPIKPNVPAVPDRARTIIYISCLIVNVLAFVGFGLGTVFGLIDSEQATEASTIILGGIGILSGGLAVGYRPTR